MTNPILKGYTKKYQPLVIKPKYWFSAKVIIVCLLLGLFIALFSSCSMTPARADIISIAQSQIGLGELGGNNRGIYVRKYLNGQEGLPWCAGFVSWCMKEAGYDLPYLLRAKSFLKYGNPVSEPQAEDLIIFSRKGGGHVAIVEKVSKDAIITIEGNLGEYPSKVKRVNYKRGQIKNLLGFVRLQERFTKKEVSHL